MLKNANQKAIQKDTVETASKNLTDKPDNSMEFPVVGVGASAGGLEALEGFFSNLDPHNDIALIIVTHQLPGHLSLLPDLLAGFTDRAVIPAESGLVLKKNRVYVCPPGQNLAILNRRIHLMEPVDFLETHLPIDYFFRSLAEDIKHKAIAIILSGTGSDGTLGLKDIKTQGGMTMAQSPDSAKFAGMPSSAIASGEVDFVLPVDQMGQQLAEYVESINFKRFDQMALEHMIDIEPIQKIFIMVRNKTGHDLSAYKLTTIRRRIIRRMNIHRIANVEHYVHFLQENPYEIGVLFKELLINVTHFFRDPEAYGALAQNALPKLLETKHYHDELRVWVVGCSSGEEAYSIGILLKELMEKQHKMLKLQIFATDLDEDAINRAREGLYPAAIESNVSAERLNRFFKKENDGYRIGKEIRDAVVFASQNLIKDPPFTHLDLISCRNLLIYLNADLQNELFPQFHYALNKDGLLFLGTSESICGFNDLFTALNKKWKIYRRNESSIRFPVSKLSTSSITSSVKPLSAEPPLIFGLQNNQVSKQIEKMLLQLYAPVSVVINEHGKIIYVHGRTGNYLELSPGQPNINIIELARDGLRVPLATMLRQAKKISGTEKLNQRIPIKTNDNHEWIDLNLIRINEPETLRHLLLVSFQPCLTEPGHHGSEPAQQEIAPADNQEKGQLEEELYFTKESLYATIEELETSNEELKSANEELQSSTEELETSKEEMQSLNEELNTVNSELQNKVEALSQSHDDMQNLLNATDIATIFLDNTLKIKRFTRPATQLIKLIDTDVGRPLEDLVSTLHYKDLIDDAKLVLQTLVFKTKEVQSTDGNWYSLRILPYRTAENMINGLVITFIDINRVKRAEKTVQDADMARAIVETVRHPLLVLDSEFFVTAANPAFYRTFQLTPESVEHQSFFAIAEGAFDTSELYGLLTKTRDRNVTVNNFIYHRKFIRMGFKRLTLNACILKQAAAKTPNILLAIEDVTDQSPSEHT